MTEFYVIGSIDTTDKGPKVLVPGCSYEHQALHLRQGDLDGACGPYCLFMGLMVCGVADRQEIAGLDRIHGNSSLAKALKFMEKYSPFFHEGTNMSALEGIVNSSYRSKVRAVTDAGKGAALRGFIEKNVRNDHPVIVRLDWGGEAGHWVLVVGLEYSEEQLWRFLILDPSSPPSKVSAWNGIIEATGGGGIYPYRWWNEERQKVQLDGGMALQRL